MKFDNNETSMTVTEQAIAQVVLESGDTGIKPQGSATPDSNDSAKNITTVEGGNLLQVSVSASKMEQSGLEVNKEESVQVIDTASFSGVEVESPSADKEVEQTTEMMKNDLEQNANVEKESTSVPTGQLTDCGSSDDGINQSEISEVNGLVEEKGNGVKKTRGKEKNRLTIGQIVALSVLMNWGYSFGKLKINRALNTKALKKKIKSIKLYGMVSPCLVTTAQVCLDAGLEIVSFDGIPITKDTPNLDKILIIIDGAHRHVATMEINSALKKGEVMQESYYYLPLTGNYKVMELLREANVVTKPWAGSDFLTSLIMSREEAAENEMLIWVQTKLEKSGDTAIWEWATLNKSVPSKSKLIKAAGTDEKADAVFKNISDSSKFERGKSIYNAFAKIFAESILGCKFFPEWVIDKLSKLDYMSGPEAAEHLIAFASKLNRQDAERIESIKGADKAQNVKNELDLLYKERMEKPESPVM